MWINASRSGSGGESARERPRKFFGELVEQHFEHSVFLNKDELNRLVRSLSVVAIRFVCLCAMRSLVRFLRVSPTASDFYAKNKG